MSESWNCNTCKMIKLIIKSDWASIDFIKNRGECADCYKQRHLCNICGINEVKWGKCKECFKKKISEKCLL